MAYKTSEQAITQLFLLLRKRELVKLELKVERLDLLNGIIENIFVKMFSGIPWSVIESFDEINDAVSAWNNLFADVANGHAPNNAM